MTFEPWKYYRHSACLDIDIVVVGSNISVSEKGTSLRVIYYNRHYKSLQGEAETVFIPVSQYKNWSEIQEDSI
jgi:hypothetical protein